MIPYVVTFLILNAIIYKESPSNTFPFRALGDLDFNPLHLSLCVILFPTPLNQAAFPGERVCLSWKLMSDKR